MGEGQELKYCRGNGLGREINMQIHLTLLFHDSACVPPAGAAYREEGLWLGLGFMSSPSGVSAEQGEFVLALPSASQGRSHCFENLRR